MHHCDHLLICIDVIDLHRISHLCVRFPGGKDSGDDTEICCVQEVHGAVEATNGVGFVTVVGFHDFGYLGFGEVVDVYLFESQILLDIVQF